METQFLKEVSLIGGGYLVSGEKPVYNEKFVKAQERAYFLSVLAEKVSKANFEQNKVDNFNDIYRDVAKQISKESETEYKKVPTQPKSKFLDDQRKAALDFLNFKDEKNKTIKFNRLMQEFNILKEFEDFGLFFTNEKTVKLNGLFEIKQIEKFVDIIIDHLD